MNLLKWSVRVLFGILSIPGRLIAAFSAIIGIIGGWAYNDEKQTKYSKELLGWAVKFSPDKD